MFGLFKKKPKEIPRHRRGGYPKPTRLPGAYKKWQPPAREPIKPEAVASERGNPES